MSRNFNVFKVREEYVSRKFEESLNDECDSFGLVGLYGLLLLIVGYLIPNPVNTYVLNIYMIWKHILLIISLK